MLSLWGWQDLWLALFPLEPIVLVAQSLDFFGLLGYFGRQLFHQVHQRDDHLAHTFIFNALGIEIFYHTDTLHVPSGFRLVDLPLSRRFGYIALTIHAHFSATGQGQKCLFHDVMGYAPPNY